MLAMREGEILKDIGAGEQDDDNQGTQCLTKGPFSIHMRMGPD